jgi:hypothetical protein
MGLRNAYRLSSANIKILPAGATDPMSIVVFTQAEMTREPYDRAYCVFDRDGHQNYDAALQRIASSDEGRSGRLVGITSWPCFEFWILLHFVYSASPFTATGRRSSCDRVLAELQKHLPAYTKGHQNIFQMLAPKLEAALKHAVRLERQNSANGTTNPHTKVHDLVGNLIRLKSA